MKVPALAMGAAAGVLAAWALLPATLAALTALETVRSAREAGQALAVRSPPPLLPSGQVIRASTQGSASAALAAGLRQSATSSGVLIESLAPVEGGSLARVRLSLSGSEAAVLGLAVRIERSAPVARFTQWRVEGSAGGVRLLGEVAAPWG